MKTTLADKWFSIYIRLRDADDDGYIRCCTCGRVKKWREADCGHFIKRQFVGVRFSEFNCHAQCKGCNNFLQGNDVNYSQFIIEKYGRDRFDLLMSAKRKSGKISQFEVDIIAKEYKEKATKLAKEKGLTI